MEQGFVVTHEHEADRRDMRILCGLNPDEDPLKLPGSDLLTKLSKK